MKYITANLLNRLWKNGVLPALGKKAEKEHTHDDRYYTENEVNNKLNGKLSKNDAGGIATCGGDGKYTYFKVATIKITESYINRPIVFELSGRGKCLSQVTVMFASVSNTDPALSVFRSNQENSFWIKKTATSTWEIYGQYNETYGSYALHRITGTGADIGVTVNMVNISSLPSGCTQVSYGGNVAYANNAGSVAWTSVTGRPSSLPANGGNATTVNGHNVNADVPIGAKFTDTNTWRPQPDWNATSGDAAIKNKPTIPSVGNGTITITQNGATKGTFTTNQSGNTTIALSDNNTTYGTATSSSNGLMSSGDKSKLDGIASGANKTTVDASMSSTSTNPVQNKVVNSALGGKLSTRNVANNLTTNVAGYALDARQGKALKDSVDALNGSLFPDSCTIIAPAGSTGVKEFTAPSNGYVYAVSIAANTGYGAIIIENQTNAFNTASNVYGSPGDIGVIAYVPVKKGQICSIRPWGACKSYEARFYNAT